MMEAKPSPEEPGADSNRSPNPHRTVRQVLGAVAAAGVLAVTVKYGPGVLRDLRNTTSTASEAVAGVPSLVVGHDSRFAHTVGSVYTWRYWLDIEQCPQDVDAARAGSPTRGSFNPDPSSITNGCYADWVRVGADTYSTFPDGSSITFAGVPGTPLTK